jgi:hypothetical protein
VIALFDIKINTYILGVFLSLSCIDKCHKSQTANLNQLNNLNLKLHTNPLAGKGELFAPEPAAYQRGELVQGPRLQAGNTVIDLKYC